MTTHKGSCHCGKIAYEFDGEIGTVLECNCSMCRRRGSLLHFIPAASFRLKTPHENLGTYQFNKHVINHHFCPTCGIAPFSEGKGPTGEEMVAINARCVEDIDAWKLQTKFYDGKSA